MRLALCLFVPALLSAAPSPSEKPAATAVSKPVGERPAITVSGEAEVSPGDQAILRLAAPGATKFDWTPANHEKPVFDPLESGAYVAFSSGVPGEYVWVVSVAEGQAATPLKVRIKVGGGPNPPPAPPTPGPQPGPGPQPDDAKPPFPVKGLTVLITYESETRARLPQGQAAILQSRHVRNFLDSKCVVGPDGKTRDWRMWDDETDVSAAPELWKAAMAVPRQKDEWLVVNNGRSFYSGPLPATAEEFMSLVSKYAE